MGDDFCGVFESLRDSVYDVGDIGAKEGAVLNEGQLWRFSRVLREMKKISVILI